MYSNEQALREALIVDAILDIDEQTPLLSVHPNTNTQRSSYTPAQSDTTRTHTHTQSDTLCTIDEEDLKFDPRKHLYRTDSARTLIGIERPSSSASEDYPKKPAYDPERDLESSPLLEESPASKPTPLPWSQLLIILALQFAEPLSSQVINPFVVEV